MNICNHTQCSLGISRNQMQQIFFTQQRQFIQDLSLDIFEENERLRVSTLKRMINKVIANEMSLSLKKVKILEIAQEKPIWEKTVDQYIDFMCGKLKTRAFPKITDFRYYSSFLLNFFINNDIYRQNSSPLILARLGKLPEPYQTSFQASHTESLLRNFRQQKYVKVLKREREAEEIRLELQREESKQEEEVEQDADKEVEDSLERVKFVEFKAKSTQISKWIFEAWSGKKAISIIDFLPFRKLLDIEGLQIATLGLQLFRSEGIKLLTGHGFSNIVRLMNIFLDMASELKDAYTPKEIMILSETYFKEIFEEKNIKNVRPFKSVVNEQVSEKGKTRVYLWTEIKDHAIWQQEEFWVGSITISIFQQVLKMDRLQMGKNESLDDTLNREKINIFNLLTAYCENMKNTMFTFDKQKKIVAYFADLFQLKKPQKKDLQSRIRDNLKLAKL